MTPRRAGEPIGDVVTGTKARGGPGRAHADIAEAFAGISGEMGDADLATRRAEDQAAELGARASALDSLLSTGGLADVTATVGDDLQAQLDEISTRAAVDEELARIKERLASEAGQPAADSADGRPGRALKGGPARWRRVIGMTTCWYRGFQLMHGAPAAARKVHDSFIAALAASIT